MKAQLISAGCLVLALVFLYVSFTTADLRVAELTKALAVVPFLITIKYLQPEDPAENG
ncbi:MAG TPA: hypothetical protein PKE63_03875 [Lacibacter sp.]|nr:hypothetical protein [Lacibacter sp.]HMO88471.1 hypothetical protein [Lacibacter sp.]HMP86389.1 hypothetical protein [Lacibacter sp.]